MMNDLASLIDFLIAVGLPAIPIVLILWLAHGSEAPAGSPFAIRCDMSSPIVPEEVDPPRWRIEPIGEGALGRSVADRSHRKTALEGSDPPVLRPLAADQGKS